MNEIKDWKNLFCDKAQIHLALALRRPEARQTVRAVSDDRTVLLGGASQAERRSGRAKKKPTTEPELVILTPETGHSQADFEKVVRNAREDYPGAELSGFGTFEGLDRVVLRAGEAGVEFTVDKELAYSLEQKEDLPTTLVLLYTPRVTPEALEQAVSEMVQVSHLVSVVALPIAAGDRIPLEGMTTSGALDMMVLTVLRHFLPLQVRVRASWAALGWKVAQLATLYGADELAGWTAAETLAYSGRVRAAARVEQDELKQGLEEAGVILSRWREPVCLEAM